MKQNLLYIKQNKDLILTKKLNALKNADNCLFLGGVSVAEEKVNKAASIEEDSQFLNVKIVANSCGIIDSHLDCHISGLWKKTISENKVNRLLNNHRYDFNSVIADSINDDLKVKTEKVPLKSLGISKDEDTECLICDVKINRKRNAEMFKNYEKGYVLEHSVGMRYVKIVLCVDDESKEFEEEKKAWDKYYKQVINKEVADEKGYFWAVLEAKLIEVSAVVMGSNSFTPVLEEIEPKGIDIEEVSAAYSHKSTDNVRESLSITNFI